MRDELGLKFVMVNQIHDAVILKVKEEHTDVVRKLLKTVMTNIGIPLPNGQLLYLDTDIEVFRKRWGEKDKH